MNRRYKALIFDWDGTLADSTAQIVEAVQTAFRGEGLPPPSTQAARQIIGLGLQDALQALLPEGVPVDAARIATAYKQHYLRDDNIIRLFADAAKLLPELRQHYWLTVATGKSRYGLNKALAQTGSEAWFLATRTVDECASKPSPDMVLSLCEELGLHPHEVLVIGDTTHDLWMAANAGAAAVALSTGAHTVEQLRSAPHLCLCGSFAEFVAWLDDQAA